MSNVWSPSTGGLPPVTANLLYTPSVTTVEAIRSMSSSLALVVNALGYYTEGDEGGGLYWANPADTASADNGGTIIVSVIDGMRWYRVNNGEVSVRCFGAKGDNVTDDTAAIRGCVAWCELADQVVRIPNGSYSVNTGTNGAGNVPIATNTPITIKGNGKYMALITTTNINSTIFDFTGTYVNLQDFGVQCSVKGATTASLVIIACETEDVTRIMLNNYGVGLQMGGNVGNYIGVDFLDVGSTSTIGCQINGYGGGLNMIDPFFYVPSLTPIAGLHFLACGGALITGANIIRMQNNILVTPGSGIQCDSIQIVNSFIDSAQNAGIAVIPQAGGIVTRMYLTQVECDSATVGMLFDGTAAGCLIDGVCIISVQAMFATTNGLQIQGVAAQVKNFDIVGGTTCGCTSAGINLVAGTGIRISDVFSGAGYGTTGNAIGIEIAAAATGVKLRNCTVTGNTTAAISGPGVAAADIAGCTGFVTKASGIGIIAIGQTISTINHGLSGTPSNANILLTSFNAPIVVALDSGLTSSTQFTAFIAPPQSVVIEFNWRASCNGDF